MAKTSMRTSTKRLLIDRANTTIVIVVAVAAAVTAFSLVASRALLSKRSYQASVINAQEKARDQLEANIEAVDVLAASYREFVDRPENVIGGNSTGTAERDGDNAKIILDALPSRYDFPALAASLEKILVDGNYQINSITGSDQPPGQSAASTGTTTPSSSSTGIESESVAIGDAQEMPFELAAQGTYTSMIDLLNASQRSIRPLAVRKLSLSAGAGSGASLVELTVEGASYFQPEKTLDIKYEVVR